MCLIWQCFAGAGMFVIIATLLVMDRVSKRAADRVLGFFGPALNWIQRWLPLFYVPTLVVLPLAIRGIPGGKASACTARASASLI